MSDFSQKVYDYLLSIPKGKVVTYGQIAEAIGCPGAARAVGNALHQNPDPDRYPCYKAVNAQGKLAANFRLGIEEQKRRLEADGIATKDLKVDLEKYRYDGHGTAAGTAECSDIFAI